VAGITRAELEERKAAAAGLAGGLASSPNVPVPGTSINPATGQPHTEGITRAELDAMKAKGGSLLDPVPTASEIRRASIIKQNFVVPDNSLSGLDPQVQKEMSGRAQAAAQLAGSTGIMMNLVPTPANPASPNAKRMSLVEDLEKNVSRLGHMAYDAIPAPVKDIFAEPKGKGPEGSPVKPRRGSAAALFDNVRAQAAKISHEISETVQHALEDPLPNVAPPTGPASTMPPVGSTTLPAYTGASSTTAQPLSSVEKEQAELRRISKETQDRLIAAKATSPGMTGHEVGVFAQVKDFVQSAVQGAVDGTTGVGPAPAKSVSQGVSAPKAVLPTQENQGPRPGEVSGGIGAILANIGGEGGVAVPSEMKTNQAATGPHDTVSPANQAAPSTSGLAAPTALDREAGHTPAAPAPTSIPSEAASHTASTGASGLAAPLPATILGLGAAYGATDLKKTSGVSEDTAAPSAPHTAASEVTSTALDSSSGISSAASSSTAATTLPQESSVRQPNDRTESLASVTAIRHGHTGNRDHRSEVSPLATSALEEVPSHGQQSTTRGTGPNHTTSLTPGEANGGIGHPETRDKEGTSRQPGSYPAVQHDGDKPEHHGHSSDGETAATASTAASAPSTKSEEVKPSTTTGDAATSPSTTKTESATHSNTPISPARKSMEKQSANGHDSAHGRKGSTGSGSGKKVGFMKKLKEKFRHD